MEPTPSHSADDHAQNTIRIEQTDLKSLLETKDQLFQVQAEYNAYRYEKSEEIEELQDKINKLKDVEDDLLYLRNHNNLIIEIDKK